jgi:hypothetical protein
MNCSILLLTILFWAKAHVLLFIIYPRPKGHGNSKFVNFQFPNFN